MQRHCDDYIWYPKESTEIKYIRIDCRKEAGPPEMLRKEFRDKYEHFVTVQYHQKGTAHNRHMFATDAATAKDLQDILQSPQKCESPGKLIADLRKANILISDDDLEWDFPQSTPSKHLAVDQNASSFLDRKRPHAEDDVSGPARDWPRILFSSSDFALEDDIGDVQEKISDDRSDDITIIHDDPQPVTSTSRPSGSRVLQRDEIKTDAAAAPRAAAAVQAAPAAPSTKGTATVAKTTVVKTTKIARQLPAWLEGAVSAVPEAKPVGKTDETAAQVEVFTTDTVPNLPQPVVSTTASEWLESVCRPKPVTSIAEVKRRRGIP
jgi:hypothetical protein